MRDKGPINHHYLAKCYLRSWTEDGHVWQYERVNRHARRIGINKVASERYFNELKGLPTTGELFRNRKAIETLLAKVDSIGARVLTLLREVNEPADLIQNSDVRKDLIRYVAYQFLRGPAVRASIGNIESPLGVKVANAYLRKAGLDVTVENMTSAQRAGFFDENWAKHQHFTYIFYGYQRTVSSLYSLSWSMLLNNQEHRSFVTSDSVIVIKKVRDDKTCIYYPISPRCLLILGGDTEEMSRDCTLLEVQDANLLQLQQSYRRVYCRAEEINNVKTEANSHPECEIADDRSIDESDVAEPWWLEDAFEDLNN